MARPKVERTALSLRPRTELVARVDELAATAGVSRSAWIESAITSAVSVANDRMLNEMDWVGAPVVPTESHPPPVAPPKAGAPTMDLLVTTRGTDGPRVPKAPTRAEVSPIWKTGKR